MIVDNTKPTPVLQEQLPFEIRTVALAVWKWHWCIFIWGIASLAIGITVGLEFGPQNYLVSVTLKHSPPPKSITEGVIDPTNIETLKNSFKIDSIMEPVRLKLKPEKDRFAFAKAFTVTHPKDTQLVNIEVRADSAELAFEMADESTRIFIEQTHELRNKRINDHVKTLREDHEKLLSDLGKLRGSNSKEVTEYNSRLEGLKKRLTEIEAKILSLENEALDKSIMAKELSAAMDEMLAEGNVEGARAAELNAKATALREIANLNLERERQKLNHDLIEESETNMDMLVSQGVISAESRDANLKSQKLRSLNVHDTESVTVKKIYEILGQIESLSSNSSSTNPAIQALESQILTFNAGLKSCKLQMEKLIENQSQVVRDIQTLQENAPAQIDDKEQRDELRSRMLDIETKIHDLEALLDDNELQFVQPPLIPTKPEKSYRKMLAGAASLGLAGFGFGLILLWEACYLRYRSGRELKLRTGLETIFEIPYSKNLARRNRKRQDKAFASAQSAARRLAHLLRVEAGNGGLSVLFASGNGEEGKATVAQLVSRSLAGQGKQVVIIDLTSNAFAKTWEGVLEKSEDSANQPGIFDYLENPSIEIRSLLIPTLHTNVSLIRAGNAEAIPDSIGQVEFQQLIRDLTERGHYVLVISPPLIGHSETELIARSVDVAVLIVRAHYGFFWSTKKVLDRLRLTGTPVIAGVLNRVRLGFFDKELA